MYWVYILQMKDGRYYYGYSSALRQRLQDHHDGKVYSTRLYRPVKIVYFETYRLLVQARERERQLKNGSTRRKTIEWMIRTFDPTLLLPFA